MVKRHRTLGDNGSKYTNNYKLILIQLHYYNCKNNTLIIIYYFLKPTMDQWLKQQPLKRKQEPVQATAITESAETNTSDARGDTKDGDDNRIQRKIVRRYEYDDS